MIRLGDLSNDFRSHDQPIRIFQRSVRDDAVIVVIERENNLIPSIHQEIGVIALQLGPEKKLVRVASKQAVDQSTVDSSICVYQGALLEFSAFEDQEVSIWHPNRHNSRSFSIINPIDSETVQIESKFGSVLRAVSPRVKPKSYRLAAGVKQSRKKSKNSRKTSLPAPTHARVNRQYKINVRGTHFCEISHAGRLIRNASIFNFIVIGLMIHGK